MTGMTMIFGLTPNIQALFKSKVTGKQIFDVIERLPLIRDTDSPDPPPFKLDTSITFKNVSFKYPTAPENAKNVLDQISFEIKAGETTAIVGPSGSGKSTIV
jgi:ABC-type multidrug transport system fused ATPase/permease subunit